MSKLLFILDKETTFVLMHLTGMIIISGWAYVTVIHLLFLVLKKGDEWYLKSILYLTLLKFLNPIFGHFDKNLYYVFIFMIFILVVYKIYQKKLISFSHLEKKFYIVLVLFYITTIVGSFYVDLSIIKLTIYSIIVFTIFQSIKLSKDFGFIFFLVKLLYLYVWVSLPLIFFGSGYYYNGLFMGVTQHSQSIGIILVPILTLFIVLFFQKGIKQNVINLSTIFLGFIEIYLSGSRTALVSILVPLLLYFIINGVFRSKFPIKYLIFFLLFFIGSFVYYISHSDAIDKKVDTFVNKSYGLRRVHHSSVEEMLGRRGYLMEISKENFLQHPWTGIGFNVQTKYADLKDEDIDRLKYIPGTNILYNKPLEKGNLYFAVFEEGGGITGMYFLYTLVFLFFSLFKRKNVFGWVTVLSIIISFNGEAALFSPGGAGPYQLAVFVILFSLTRIKNGNPGLKKGCI